MGHSYGFPLLPHGTCFGLLGITKYISLHSFTPRHRLLISRFLNFSNYFLLRKIHYFLNLASSVAHQWSTFIIFCAVCRTSRYYHDCATHPGLLQHPGFDAWELHVQSHTLFSASNSLPSRISTTQIPPSLIFLYGSTYPIGIQSQGLFK